MRAVIQQGFGDPSEVLGVEEVTVPSPGAGQVLVRVRAAAVHADVWHAVTGRPWVMRLIIGRLRGQRQPTPGIDMAGVVEAVGPDAGRFAPGDAVFGEVLEANNQWHNGGTWAEYVAVAEHRLAPMPDTLTFEEAACVPTSGLIAQQALGQARVGSGSRLLVNGAAGGVGAFTVQLAKAAGAHVTGVDHTDKLALLASIGTDETVDYTAEDVTTRDERWDAIVDVASTMTLRDASRVLTDDGLYVRIGHDHYGAEGRCVGSLGGFLGLVARSPFSRHLPPIGDTERPPEAMDRLAELAASGGLSVVVDRAFGLGGAADALDLLASGRNLGRIVMVP